MTTLLVEPLVTELSQEFQFKLEGRCILASIAPYVYMFNSPAGEFYFSVFKNADLVFMDAFNCNEIKAALLTANGYAHTFHPMTPTNPVFFTKGVYTAVLNATGYSYSGNSYLGWVRQHENIQDEMDYVPATDNHNPLAMRRKIYKQGIR